MESYSPNGRKEPDMTEATEHACMSICICAKEYNPVIRKNETVSLAASWMDPEITMLSEVNQTKKDKYRMISLNVESVEMRQMSLSTKYASKVAQ